MNISLVAMNGDTYPYRAYLVMLLSYGCDAKETWLRHLEGSKMDEDGKYDAQENISLISSRGMITGCTRTCCCKSDWCQTTWMSGWCCHVASLIDFGGQPESHVCIKEDILEVRKVKVIPSKQLHLEKILTASGARYLLAHVVTRHLTMGASMADMYSLFTGQIPTKVLISLVSNEAFVSTSQKNPFNFAHIGLNSACLGVDGRPIPAQPWQPDFMQGLYAETYHALLKFSGMHLSYWSNGMSVEQFLGGSMLLSWGLMLDDSNGVAYLSLRHLGTVKASLRFAKPLPVTTTLIAYAQYDNLVVVDAYRTVTFDYNVWCLGWQLLEPQKREWLAAMALAVSTPLAPVCMVPGCLPDQHGLWRGCCGTLTGCFAQGHSACGVLQFFRHRTTGVRLLSMDYPDIWYSTKILQGLFSRSCRLYAIYFLAMCSRGVPLGIITGAFQEYDFAYNEAQIRHLLRWHTHAYIQWRRPPIIIRPPVYIREKVNASTVFFLAIIMVPIVLALGSSHLEVWHPCAWSVTTCQKLATALTTLILLTLCSYTWTTNHRPGNMPVRSLCGASLMHVVLYSIAPKDNLHHTSVFPLTFSAGLTSLYHQQQWLPLMTRTVLVKAAAGAPPWPASEPTEDTPVYGISSKHGLLAHGGWGVGGGDGGW